MNTFTCFTLHNYFMFFVTQVKRVLMCYQFKHVNLCRCVHVFILKHTQRFVWYMCLYVCMCVCMCMYMCGCMHACTCVYTCVYASDQYSPRLCPRVVWPSVIGCYDNTSQLATRTWLLANRFFHKWFGLATVPIVLSQWSYFNEEKNLTT